MVQVFDPTPRSSQAGQLGQAFGTGFSKIGQNLGMQKQQSQLAEALFGEEAEQFAGQSVQTLLDVAKMRAPKDPPGGLTGQATPPEVGNAINHVIKNNPEASPEELTIAMDQAGIPRAFSNSIIESRRKKEEIQSKGAVSKEESIRKEVLPLKQEIAKKATAAREGLQNKKALMEIIDTGNLNDPTYAAFALALPFNLGERLLSNETSAYRAGLVEEFKDLKTIFQGQTRTAELDILQKKLPDVYLTDGQKKSVLKSRTKALQGDVIREEAAAIVEEKFPNAGLFQWNKKVDELAQPKMQALFDEIVDEHNYIFQQAERRKNSGLPLDKTNEEDREIIKQILKEAGNDFKKAAEIATKKGYTF